MLKTNQLLYKAVLIFNLLCIAAGVIFAARTAVSPEADIYLQISSLCAMPAMLYAAYYLLAGFGKNAAKYYKLFAALFLFFEAVVLIALFLSRAAALPLLLTACVLVLLAVLLFVKNLGKTVSLTLCALIFVLCVIRLITGIAAHPGPALGGDAYGTLLMGRSAIGVILALLLGVLNYAKYVDKTARGTK